MRQQAIQLETKSGFEHDFATGLELVVDPNKMKRAITENNNTHAASFASVMMVCEAASFFKRFQAPSKPTAFSNLTLALASWQALVLSVMANLKDKSSMTNKWLLKAV